MKQIENGSVDLIVTSPPYPMVEMWDGVFSDMDPEVRTLLDSYDGMAACTAMHLCLKPIWEECYRVLAGGGLVCVNIGDATRKIGAEFKLYPNHTILTNILTEIGFNPLPYIIWKKEGNKPNKFMGSGMLPSNAYVTMDHEFILIFRKGGKREFTHEEKSIRSMSGYFWEERNKWFTGVWEDVKGVSQDMSRNNIRQRSAAFPIELPYRLINMFSIHGDTILDPFLGTGTSAVSSICTGRNFIGYDVDESLSTLIHDRMMDAPELSSRLKAGRLSAHEEFAENYFDDGRSEHRSSQYDFGIVTKQESAIAIPLVEKVWMERSNDDGNHRVYRSNLKI